MLDPLRGGGGRGLIRKTRPPSFVRRNMNTRVGQQSIISSTASIRLSLFRRVSEVAGRELLLPVDPERIIPDIEGCTNSAGNRTRLRRNTARSRKEAVTGPVVLPYTVAFSTTLSIHRNCLPSSIAMIPTVLLSLNNSNLHTKSRLSYALNQLSKTLHTPLASAGGVVRYFSSSPEVQLRKQRSSQVASFFVCPSPRSPTGSVDYTESRAITTIEKPSIQTHKLGYHVSAAFSAKSEKVENPHNFTYSPYKNVCLNRKLPFEQRKRLRLPSGQDAFFITKTHEQGGVAVGVADGVGGYASLGVDSADVSHELCEIMACMAQSTREVQHPRSLLNAAYVKLIEDQEVIGGGSTACVGIASPNGSLTVANLGDSGYAIFRYGKVLHTSAPQTHSFNTPYQLSIISEILLERSRTFGSHLCDLPKDANVATHNLVHGDVVVFATDGLWDNLFTHQIFKIVCQEMIDHKGWIHGKNEEPPAEGETRRGIYPSDKLAQLTEHDGTGLQTVLANAIAAKAKRMSFDTKVDTPFSKEVNRRLPFMRDTGGKVDDICVICMIAVEAEESRKPSFSGSSPQAQSESTSESAGIQEKSVKEKDADSPSGNLA